MTSDTNQREAFVENTGLFFERLGLQRMAGRIIGWLLICDPSHQTMGEIVEALKASKSTISTSLKQLQMIALVERFTLPGDRRDYYRLTDDVWRRSFEAKTKDAAEFRRLAEQGLQVLKDDLPQKRERLELMRDMYAFIEREVPILLDRWDEEKRQRGKS